MESEGALRRGPSADGRLDRAAPTVALLQPLTHRGETDCLCGITASHAQRLYSEATGAPDNGVSATDTNDVVDRHLSMSRDCKARQPAVSVKPGNLP